MSLITDVPSFAKVEALPFLLQVRFDEYAKRLAPLTDDIADPQCIPLDASAGIRQIATAPLLTRYAGFDGKLTELQTVLASAGVNSMWIRGEPGTGKTALTDEFIRARSEKRLSGSIFGGPFFLFNVSLFLTQLPASWMADFNTALDVVAESHGLLIIDHIDDLVQASREYSDRLMQSLIAALDSSDNMQCIIISDAKNNDAVDSASTGILRRFQVMDADEPKLDSLKPVLMSHFRRLSRVHNVEYSESVADEIIRLLGRYPARAFTTNKRPEKAISFADKVGAMVRMNVFGEPAGLAELRDHIGALRDTLDVTRRNRGVSAAATETMRQQLSAFTAQYTVADRAYKDRFGYYLKAKQALDEIESRLGPIEAKSQASRPADEKRDFNTLKDAIEPARHQLAQEERKVHAVRPEVTKADVRKIFSDYSGVPLSNLSANKLERLSCLEANLVAEIFGQEAPVKAVVKVWRERELGVSDPSRPAGVLLFTGGTGLGKTELMKVLARWDGGEAASPAIIRMSELKDKSAVSRLTGAAPGLVGFDEGAPAIEECENKDIVVFDEIDKADPNIYDVMMQILDEGEITLSNGRKISFKGKLIVITTNALRAEDITEDELDNQDQHQDRIRALLCEAKSKDTGTALFRPEFIGRVDELYVYKSLDQDAALKILEKEIRKINRDYQERGISIESDHASLLAIIDKYYVPSQGGRSPRQIVKKRIRPIVTDYLMARMLERANEESVLNERLCLKYDLASDHFGIKAIVNIGHDMAGDCSIKVLFAGKG